VTYNEDLSTKPRCQAQFATLFGLSGPLPTRDMKLKYLNFYGNLLKLADQYLVDILDALQWTNQLDNTLVVRTADHGEMALAHTMRQKSFNAYEETIHLPLVFSNPVLYPTGRKSDQLVSHVDLLPTLASLVEAPRSARSADWAGIDYSAHVLGAGGEPTQDRVVFTFDDWQSGQSKGPYIPAPNRIVMVRERRWKLAKYYDAAGKKATEWEMYDLKKDPLERWNLAHRPGRMTPFQRTNFRRLKRRIRRIEQHALQPLPAG
jgi:arylsulfatase A-like enzyme